MGKRRTYCYKPDKEWLQFATPKEAEILEVALKEGSFDSVHKHLKLHKKAVESRIRRLRRRAARSGYVPEHGMVTPLPEGQHLRGATIQRDGAGNIERVWTKSWKDRDSHLQAWCDALERAGETCKGIAGKVPKPRKQNRKDLLALYGIGDAHFGMNAWHREAGDNWDLAIAEEATVKGIELCALSAPPAAEALVLNAGDTAHADDNKGRTPMSGNVLDTDSRWSKVLDVILRAHVRMVKTLLAKHDRVRLVALPGNHDMQTAIVIQLCLSLLFANEPRVTVDTDRHLYTRYLFGKCLFGFHHGHGAKLQQLPLLLATKWPEDWAEAMWRRIYSGHIHHEKVLEVMGTPVESLPTLACTDSWADGMGYVSQRSILVDTWHKEDGLVQRNMTHIHHINQALKKK